MDKPLLSGPALRWLAAALVMVNGFFPALWILFTSLKTEAERLTHLVGRPLCDQRSVDDL